VIGGEAEVRLLGGDDEVARPVLLWYRVAKGGAFVVCSECKDQAPTGRGLFLQLDDELVVAVRDRVSLSIDA